MEKVKVCWVIPTEPSLRESIQAACPQAQIDFCERTALDEQRVADAEVVIGNLPKRWLPEARALRWLHLESAGAEQYAQDELLGEDVLLSNSTGAYGPAIAEHMLAGVLSIYKKLNLYRENQKLRVWKNEGQVRSLKGSSVLIVGLGDIGREFGWRMKALGCTVTGVKRTLGGCPAYVDRLVLMDQIEEELPNADIVALCLPSTPETRHFFDQRRLALTRRDCVLVNVGRGVTVDTPALCALLDQGHFGGLVLDVVDPEPLPMNNPLWGYDRVILTPHVSGNYNQQSTYDTVIAMALENLQRYLDRQPLKYQVDRQSGYRISNNGE